MKSLILIAILDVAACAPGPELSNADFDGQAAAGPQVAGFGAGASGLAHD